MAQTFDSKQTFKRTTTGTTSTWSHTIGAGANRVLVVLVSVELTAHGVTGVTYNGVAMTLGGEQNGPTSMSVAAWYMLDPPVGTADIVASHPSSLNRHFHSASFIADGAFAFDQWVSENVTAVEATTSLSVTPAVDPSLCVDIVADQAQSQTGAAGGEQTVLYDEASGTAHRARSSYKLDRTNTATTFSWGKATTSADTSQGIIVLSEVAGVDGTVTAGTATATGQAATATAGASATATAGTASAAGHLVTASAGATAVVASGTATATGGSVQATAAALALVSVGSATGTGWPVVGIAGSSIAGALIGRVQILPARFAVGAVQSAHTAHVAAGSARWGVGTLQPARRGHVAAQTALSGVVEIEP